MTEGVKMFLAKLSGNLFPIIEQAKKYFDEDSKITQDGVAEIFRRPWVAEFNYGFWLFPLVEAIWLDRFVELTNKPIPTLYKNLLLELNGCIVYGLELYGLPKSIYTTGLLDRSRTQQLDLGSANRNWIREYDVDPSLFHIGGRSYSSSENIGYFLNGNTILSIRKSGEIISKWNTLREFLSDEISEAEKQMLQKAPESIKRL